MVRTIDGDIIVADDDGEILDDEESEDRVDPDDEGVEILTDGGGSEPTPDDLADLSDGDVVEVDTEDGDTVTLTVDDPRHPNLGGKAGNGRFSDTSPAKTASGCHYARTTKTTTTNDAATRRTSSIVRRRPG